MRHSTPAHLSVLIMLVCGQLGVAQESRSRWWPFGGSDDAVPAEQPTSSAPTYPTTSQSTAPGVPAASQAPFATSPSAATGDAGEPQLGASAPRFAWPQVEWPEVSLPRPRMPQLWPNREQAEATRNAWAGKSPDPQRPTPMQAVRDGAHRVSESTRTAWRKTVETIFPSSRMEHNTGSRIASRDIQPPFWKRILTNEPEERRDQTMSDFVGQPRP